MISGKILATLVGITTAVILLSQLASSSELMPITLEPYVNVPLRQHQEMVYEPAHCGGHKSGRKLTGEFPDSVFVSSTNLQPTSVMNTGSNLRGSALGDGGLAIQYSQNPNASGNTQAAFSSFDQAAGVLKESYDHHNHHKQCGCGASPCGCDSGNNGYGQQAANGIGSDYSPFEQSESSLPISGLTAYYQWVNHKRWDQMVT